MAFLGLLGGGLSAAVAVRHLQSSSTPLDIPVVLTLLKLPSGALSALVGLLFIRAGFLPGLSQLVSQQQILAYAFLFGIAQWLITRLVDQQAKDILSTTPITKEPIRPPIADEPPVRRPIPEEWIEPPPPTPPPPASSAPPATASPPSAAEAPAQTPGQPERRRRLSRRSGRRRT